MNASLAARAAAVCAATIVLGGIAEAQDNGNDGNQAGGNDSSWFDAIKDNFGIGVAVYTLDKNEIVGATIENGIVRVTEQRKMRAGPWLQANWVRPDNRAKTKHPKRTKHPNMQTGFFVGVEVLGGDQLIRSVGIGTLFQLRTTLPGDSTETRKKRGPIDLGIGLHWTQIQLLGSGLVPDQAIPAGVESIRYRKETQPGILLSLSFGL